MKTEIGHPDPWPPGLRRAIYSLFCWLNRHPGVWRAIGARFRRSPQLSRLIPFAARRRSVKEVLTRPASFSNTSHGPHLIAGDFLIGMDPGPTYAADRALFDAILRMLNVQADADREARARIASLASSRSADFDLLDDYLTWVVFAAIKPAFGSALDGVLTGVAGRKPDEATERRYLEEIRHVAAQLFAGSLAPAEVKRRAELSAMSLKARIDRMTSALQASWPQAGITADAVRRNGIGLAWVSHPVTVQSGALAFQELLGRPAIYRELRRQAAALGDQVWTDAAFRESVRNHVLELMRFRPIFPLLARDVPRATEFESGAAPNPKCPAGSSLTVLSIAALFDPDGMKDIGRFCPQRDWKGEADTRFLMFGFGGRQCPARDHAVTILTSALTGLLTLPELRWADRRGARIGYDGPMISRMRLKL